MMYFRLLYSDYFSDSESEGSGSDESGDDSEEEKDEAEKDTSATSPVGDHPIKPVPVGAKPTKTLNSPINETDITKNMENGSHIKTGKEQVASVDNCSLENISVESENKLPLSDCSPAKKRKLES